MKLPDAGQAIVNLRESLGLSQAELAKLLNWDRSRLNKYENNKLALSLSTVDEIAEATNTNPTLFVLDYLSVRYPGIDAGRIGELFSELRNELNGE